MSPLAEVALLFLRLGVTAFGGPAAHVAMMEAEVVQRRKWLTKERFLDLFGAASLIPGPSSSELAVFIGYERAGLPGLVVAGVCFVLPAALITAALAEVYVRVHDIPRAASVLWGIKPVVIAIVVSALVALTPKALKASPRLVAIAALAMVASLLHQEAIVVLFVAGALAALTSSFDARDKLLSFVPLPALFLAFTKIGALVFGSGYVLLAFLRDELVLRRGWLDERVLIDAVAVGQVTPGPVFTTATFIGYVLRGGPGAAVATIGIFLPGFVLVAVARPFVAKIRQSARASAFFDGVNAASLALMAVVALELGRAAVVDLATCAIAIVSFALIVRLRVNATWLVIGGALAGALHRP
jgi:chromate transporter